MRTQERLDRMLDEALEMTFPASDPFTVYKPEPDIEHHVHRYNAKAGPFPIAA